MPKQFVSLFEGKSLFQQCVCRNAAVCDRLLIVSGAEQYFLALDQLEALELNGRFLLEPIGKNTAPAITLAALSLPEDEIMLVTPSDHLIKDERSYHSAIKEAERFALEGYLVTFGITPTDPNIGYGYIEADKNTVLSFKEKPSRSSAEAFIKSGNFYWNSGMFCFKVSSFLSAMKQYAPDILSACQNAIKNAKSDLLITRVTHSDMEQIPANSIDYALMEKSDRVRVVPCDIKWSDLGSFESIYEEMQKDADNNTVSEAILINSKYNLIVESNRQIAAVDMQNTMIVDTPDALLVAKMGSGQKVREIVDKLKAKSSDLHNVHSTVHRPWGTYTVLENSERYKIKKIVVKPLKRLSLQKHFHRNEHWIVVSGTAKVTLEDKTLLVRANESTYIHAGHIHRLENPGKLDLVIIEVQVGEYLGEDDIVRIDDDFRRE
jgi:mannose-1-phosphate guanylyltransferase